METRTEGLSGDIAASEGGKRADGRQISPLQGAVVVKRGSSGLRRRHFQRWAIPVWWIHVIVARLSSLIDERSIGLGMTMSRRIYVKLFIVVIRYQHQPARGEVSFNKIATPQMADDKEASGLSRVHM